MGSKKQKCVSSCIDNGSPWTRISVSSVSMSIVTDTPHWVIRMDRLSTNGN